MTRSVSGAASARFISVTSASVSNVQLRGSRLFSSRTQSLTASGTNAPAFGPHRSATTATRVRPGAFVARRGRRRRMAIASHDGAYLSWLPPATPKRQSMPAPPKCLPLRYGPDGESTSTTSLCPSAGGRITERLYPEKKAAASVPSQRAPSAVTTRFVSCKLVGWFTSDPP